MYQSTARLDTIRANVFIYIYVMPTVSPPVSPLVANERNYWFYLNLHLGFRLFFSVISVQTKVHWRPFSNFIFCMTRLSFQWRSYRRWVLLPLLSSSSTDNLSEESYRCESEVEFEPLTHGGSNDPPNRPSPPPPPPADIHTFPCAIYIWSKCFLPDSD